MPKANSNVVAFPRSREPKASLGTFRHVGEVVCLNPLLRLWNRREKIVKTINAPGYGDLKPDDPLLQEEIAIEHKIGGTVATTAADLLVQIQLLRVWGELYALDENFDRLCDSLEYGIFSQCEPAEKLWW